MATDITRKKLVKLLGKSVEYTAILGRKSVTTNQTLIMDVMYQGKLVSDHMWVEAGLALNKIAIGTDISFRAVAHTYKDAHGYRKNGLNDCSNYKAVNAGVKQAKEDNKQKYLRSNR